MPIATTCPNCKALFRLSDDMAGEKVKCQKCQHVFIVPKAGENTLEPGMSVSRPPVDMELEPPPQATAVPMVIAAPPMPVDNPEVRVLADDEPARPSGKGTPPPIDKRFDDRRPSRRERESPTSSGSNAGMTVLIVLLLGGGLLGCVGCFAGLGWWVYARGEKNAQVAKAEKKAKLEEKKPDDAPPVQGPLQLKPGAINASLGFDGTFRHNNQLTQFDPRNPDGWRHKLYGLRLEANRTYQIDLMSQNFDAYLYLVDDANKVLARNDDVFPGNLDSRIIFSPVRTGTYYIQATSLGGNGVGGYSLVVQRR